MHHCVVVGGGLAGLSAATLLAAAGARPLVLEQRPIFGGRALVVRQDGFVLNYGYHFVFQAERSPHWRLLRRLGMQVAARPTRPTGFFMVEAEQRKPFLGAPVFSPAYGAISLRLLLTDPTAHAHQSLAELLAAWGTNERVARWLLHIARPISFLADGSRLPADRFLRWYRGFAQNVLRPSLVLPWDRLTEALARYIRTHGGEIRCGVRVEQVIPSEQAVQIVLADGKMLQAPTALLAVPPGPLARLFPAELAQPWMFGGESTAGLSLDLGFAGRQAPKGIVWDFPAERIVVCCHSNVDPTLAPPGHHLLQALALATPAQVADPAWVQTARQRLLAAAEVMAPGATTQPVIQRWLVRPMLTSLAHNGQRLAPITVPGLSRLAFASDGADAPGELSDPAVHSAVSAAQHLMQVLRH